MQNKMVKEVMNKGVVTCPFDTPVPDVARTMVKNGISAVAITDKEGYLIGLIAQTNLVILYGYQDMWPHMLAEHVMVNKVKTIAPEASAMEAARLMTEHKFHRLIVTETKTDGREKPIGVISMTDIVQDMALA